MALPQLHSTGSAPKDKRFVIEVSSVIPGLARDLRGFWAFLLIEIRVLGKIRYMKSAGESSSCHRFRENR